ncbi:hypothetical protein DR864_11500 [Runella rosea]|uniref:YhhN-like protein n=1 Tax=Runella rosea TaxID=2259595 RepID=A0A344TI57_9BACT|nr:hypothetical protein DR864_11500 [Runella rosea]
MISFNILYDIYLGIVFIDFLIGCIYYRSYKKKHIYAIVFLLFLILITELGGYFLAEKTINNAWIFNAYVIAELLILSYVFYQVFNPKMRIIICTGVLVFSLFSLFNLLFLQRNDFNSYTFVFSGILLIFYSLHYLYEYTAQKTETESWLRGVMFWFCTGSVLFYTGNILITGFIHEWIKISQSLAVELYRINKVLNLLFYILVGIGLYQEAKPNVTYK